LDGLFFPPPFADNDEDVNFCGHGIGLPKANPSTTSTTFSDNRIERTAKSEAIA
jgi:hypothetical protein